MVLGQLQDRLVQINDFWGKVKHMTKKSPKIFPNPTVLWLNRDKSILHLWATVALPASRALNHRAGQAAWLALHRRPSSGRCQNLRHSGPVLITVVLINEVSLSPQDMGGFPEWGYPKNARWMVFLVESPSFDSWMIFGVPENGIGNLHMFQAVVGSILRR